MVIGNELTTMRFATGLFQTCELDSVELSVLKRIDELKKELSYATTQPNRWNGLLRRNTFAKAVHGSNSIEGYELTMDDVVAVVEGEEPLDPKTENWYANLGYRRAMTLILQKADAPHFEYSTEFLNSLHYMMLEYDLSKHPGNWRTGSIFVRDDRNDVIVYEGPPGERVPGLMRKLVDGLNEDSGTHPIISAALAHLNFVMIHPHSDGNGRMARGLQTLVLARAGSAQPTFASIEEYLGRNTQDYYNVLAEVGRGSWSPDRDTRPWIRFNLTAHFRQATTLLRRCHYYKDLFDEIERTIMGAGLPERALFGLAEAALGFKVRNPIYRNLADVGMRAAGRDLKQIVEAGYLDPQGRKRGTYYLASEKLKSVAARVPRPDRVGDPFELLEHQGQSTLPGFEGALLS